jgi:hypothetical protein
VISEKDSHLNTEMTRTLLNVDVQNMSYEDKLASFRVGVFSACIQEMLFPFLFLCVDDQFDLILSICYNTSSDVRAVVSSRFLLQELLEQMEEALDENDP